MILVKTYYDKDPDGISIPMNVALEKLPISYHGPFDTISDAVDWMENDWPEGDEFYSQIADDFDLPEGTAINAPSSVHGDIPDEDMREITEEELHDLGPV